MKRWLVWVVFFCGAYAVLLLLAGLATRRLVTDSSKKEIAAALSRRLGVPVSAGEVHFDLASWFLLRPAVSFGEIAIGNAPGFRERNLLTAKRISARVALLPLLDRRIEIRSILIDTPRITVESDARNETNIEALLKKLSSPAPLKAPSQPATDSNSAPALGIDDFRVAHGEVVILGASSAEPPIEISAIELHLQDLSAGIKCRLEASGKFFGGAGSDSGFRLQGSAGPFGPAVLPLNGRLTLTIAPREIPERIRREWFGVLLPEPGNKARATLEVSIRGDLYNTIAGPAHLTLAGIQIGRDASHTMRLEGEAPALFSAQKTMSEPAFLLHVLNARLKLGEGEWAGAADFRIHGGAVSGGSSGSIRNVEINTLLGSLTSDGGGKIYGTIEVPSYSARFAGKTADEMRSSLAGTAKLSVTKGRISLLDMLSSIKQGLWSGQSSTASAPGSTAFSALTADLAVSQSRLNLSAIVFDSPALRFTGNGSIGFDRSLHFDLDARIAGSEAALPVVISGTVDRLVVRPSAGKLVTGAVQGLVQGLFRKGK